MRLVLRQPNHLVWARQQPRRIEAQRRKPLAAGNVLVRAEGEIVIVRAMKTPLNLFKRHREALIIYQPDFREHALTARGSR